VNDALRKRLAKRARNRCEYCLYPETEALIPHQLDHIVARQHGGSDEEDNLAFCCAVCNRHKGPNLTSLDPDTKKLARLFNPRLQGWSDHFLLEQGRIVGLTPTGRATAFLLRFNDPERLAERMALSAAGRFGS
jgi:hypothetical protein